ncbi:penicillin-binding protein 2 [Phocaeicola faecicola]|uniref:penicillin-binding protein 2 n=1 Tax=Phocaeicola faecicola TaxID=2739389 RepID=UPI0015B559AB|nr:penicillin-binding protein 2 [Phocaeicola faecicola]MCI5742060.1 penicillin-binding protein 2 [Bacteroides sp.]MDD6907414.1 penicillin-binding protein 2 [Bacteroidaceae bacterium]MDY4871502.1 penicillin-binding protein 2 [Phocaeicola faecicola]
MDRNYDLVKRRYVIGGAVFFVALLFIVRLFFLQIMSDDYKKNADSNAFLKKIQYPSRGVIYDRNDRLLVYNQPAYDITVVMKEMVSLDTADLCQTLNLTPEFVRNRFRDMKNRRLNPGYSPYTNQVFMTQLSAEDCGVFQEKLFKFPGFYIQRRTIRQYNYNAGAHILGDIAEVSKSEMEDDEYYLPGDFIGKLGVERSYEKQLRGEKGVEVLLRDAHGRIQGNYMNGKFDKPSVPGKNLVLSLDIDLQMLGERLLEGKIGSIVAIEPETGEVLCMVSSPSYDPHMMIGRNRGKNHNEMARDPWKPLLNRAIMGTYPPGSTFKTTQALTFLQEGIINTGTSYPCFGGFSYKGLHVGCHGHPSPLSLVPAIATSCNGYFCWGLYYMIGARQKYGTVQKAMNTWRDYMVSMGFGYTLGIDLPGEKRGMIPNANFYDKAYRGSWNGLTVISISIGQGEVTATPLQIANLGATIANRGYFVTPHVVKKVEGEALDSLYTQRRYTKVDASHYDEVVQGMRAAVTGGTCRMANLPDIEVCGKTGTAQNHGKDHSAFMGFAPMNNPKIAIAVYVENGGWGATYGVPIGRLMIEQYLKGKLSPEDEVLATDIQKRRIDYGLQER